MKMSVLWSFGVILSVILVVNASDFHYPNLEANEGFPTWGGICDVGKAQSPINLNRKASKQGFYQPIEFKNYDRRQTSLQVVNNGHTIQLNNFATSMEISGGPLLGHYQVEQIHIHWDSEHTIEKDRFPLEVHIVHRNKQYLSFTEAVKIPDGVAVVGLLYHYSNKDANSALSQIVSVLPSIQDAGQVNKPIKIDSFRVSELFDEFGTYFTYNGSLTTPTCDETVIWIVSEKVFPVTAEQVKALKKVQSADGQNILNNYRFLQKQNDRLVSMGDARGTGSKASTPAQILVMLMISCIVKFLN